MSEPLQAAISAARQAGEALLQSFGTAIAVEEKAMRADLVTQADRDSEQIVFSFLRRSYPHAAYLGEETGEERGSSGERWIVDPLDGTTNYAHAYPLFCVSVAYEVDGLVRAGVVFAPAMNELFAAALGEGATLNGKSVHVSTIDSLGAAMVCTGFQPANYTRNGKYFALASEHTQGVRRDGAAALDLAYVAAGRFDAFWEFDLHPWDLAAGSLIVREAGGAVTQIDGSAHSLSSDSVLASNGHVHEEARALFSRLRG